MPVYTFKHPKTSATKDVYVALSEPAKSRQIHVDEKGVKWKRVYEAPTAGIDTKIDPFSQKEFREKTFAKRGETVGDQWDRSAELSAQRAEKNGGTDPVKEKYLANYSKTRRGTPHMSKLAESHKKAKEKVEATFKKLGLTGADIPKIRLA
jgi:hypothetical protein